MAVLDLVSKIEVNFIEFSSQNKPIIMTYLSDKQIVRPSGYMESMSTFKAFGLSGGIHPCIFQVRQFFCHFKNHDNGCLLYDRHSLNVEFPISESW